MNFIVKNVILNGANSLNNKYQHRRVNTRTREAKKRELTKKHSIKSLQFIHSYNLIITIALYLHNKIKMQVVVI